MYRDVAVRSFDEKLTKENFFTFFHINVQLMIRLRVYGVIPYSNASIRTTAEPSTSRRLEMLSVDSVLMSEELVKGDVKKRVRALFDFYDIDQEGSISYNGLLEMVTSSFISAL